MAEPVTTAQPAQQGKRPQRRTLIITGVVAIGAGVIYFLWSNRGSASSAQQAADQAASGAVDYSGEISALQSELATLEGQIANQQGGGSTGGSPPPKRKRKRRRRRGVRPGTPGSRKSGGGGTGPPTRAGVSIPRLRAVNPQQPIGVFGLPVIAPPPPDTQPGRLPWTG